MTKRIRLLILLITIGLTVGLFLGLKSYTYAEQSYTCPRDYNLEQCYAYLQEKKQNVEQQRNSLKKKLSQLTKQEDNIYAQLQYTNAKIKDLELKLKEIKLKIEMLSLDLKKAQDEKKQIQDKIDAYQEEINILKRKMTSALALKYALSSTPWYYYLAKGDLYDLFELIELYNYYVTTNKGKVYYYKQLSEQINKELKKLKLQENHILVTQADIEKQNQELVKAQNELKAQKAKAQRLLAQIRKSEAEVKKRMSELKKVENQVDKALTDVLLQMWAEGNLPGTGATVAKGSIIGYQGHTGCSFGSHLHFAMYKVSGRRRIPLNPLASGYLKLSGSYLLPGRALTPVPKPLITQWFHEGYALDMVSMGAGLHNGSKYCKKKKDIRCPAYIYGTRWYKSLPDVACFNQTGEGAPVRAILGGKLYRGRDIYGSKYVLIDHGGGLISIYYHLK